MGDVETAVGAIVEPPEKRAVGFFDGQNLYRHAKAAFGHHYPNYDPIKLHAAICGAKGWKPFGVRFYTGVPAANKDRLWHDFWSHRLLAMTRAGILVTKRTLRYHDQKIELPDGTNLTDQDGYPRTVVTADGTFLADTYGTPF